MSYSILSDVVTGISEFKKSPMSSLKRAEGGSVAILNRNKPVFYCIPAKMYEALMERLDDLYLASVVASRANDEEIEVDIDTI